VKPTVYSERLHLFPTRQTTTKRGRTAGAEGRPAVLSCGNAKHLPTAGHSSTLIQPEILWLRRVLMNLSTADLSDRYPQALVADSMFRNFGGLDFFYGPIVTVKVFEDNAMVRNLLEEAGNGRVLVVDGGGSLRCALVGGNLAMLGAANGWSGILVNGCIRDSREIRGTALGV